MLHAKASSSSKDAAVASVGSDATTPGILWPTVVIMSGAVASTLSGSAVTTALPELTHVFNTTPSGIAWIVVIQTLVSATLLTVFGRISDISGRKRMYLAGMAISIVASALCGLSTNLGQLIAFRGLFAVGFTMVGANSLAYLIELYPANRRGFLVGMWEAVIATGLAIGPAVGGLILSFWSWRALFFLYVVAGTLLIPVLARVMHEHRRGASGQTFDVTGAVLFALALAPGIYALGAGRGLGWTSPVVLTCASVAIISLATFVITERRVRQPMINLGLFRSPGFSAGNLAKVCGYFAFAANSLLLPFYWDRVLHLPHDRLGLALTAFPLGMLTGSMAFGSLSDRIGTRLLAPAGMLLMTLASFAQTQMTAEMGVFPVVAAATLAGLGVGAFIAPNDSAILSVVPPDRLGVANGIMGVSRTLGMLFGQSIIAELLTARLAANNQEFLPSYRQVFVLVIAVTLAGAVLAGVRDKGRRTP